MKIKATLKDERYSPENNILKAKVEEPIEGYGRKISFNNRYAASIDTGVSVNQLPVGHILRFSLVEELAEKGMVLTTTAFNGVGDISVSVVNCGREIVNVLDGDKIVHVWLDASPEFVWSF